MGGGVDKGVEQPELDILDVGRLEVGGVELAHHAAPTVLRIVEQTLLGDVGGEIIGTALLGIVGQVEHVQRVGGTTIGRLVAVGVELVNVDGTHRVVRQLVEVALDMGGCETAGTVGEQRVDIIPGQQGTVVTAGHTLLVVMFREPGRHAGEHPRLGLVDADAVLGILEIVDIRRVVLRTAGRAGNELGKLAGEGDLRGLRTMQEG